MNNQKQFIVDLKRFGRRRVEYIKRKKKQNLHPLRIRKNIINEVEKLFDERVNTLIDQIRVYCSSPAYDPCVKQKGTVLFDDFQILSYNGDSMGKVLRKNNRIYRGIYKESVPQFAKLWNSGLLQVLGQNNIVPVTTITDYYTEEYPIILEHSIVDMYTSKCWNNLMIKDACVAMTVLKRVAVSVGFTLYDGHLNNMTFHNGCPMFTDIGSIVENKGQKTAYENSLVFAGLYRLIFNALNNSIIKRLQLYDEDNNCIWISPIYYDDATFEYYNALKAFKRYHRLHSSFLCNWMIFRLFDCYDCRPEFVELIFSTLSSGDDDSVQAVNDITQVVNIIDKLKLNIETAVDIGGTSGKLALELYKKTKAKVISVESDDARSERAYQLFTKTKAPINTVLFHYLYGADDNTRDYLRSDIAIALDITHNLRVYQLWKPDSLLNSLAKLTNKYVAVTFYPDEKYNTECFEKYFSDFFSVVCRKALADKSNGEGVLYVGKIK